MIAMIGLAMVAASALPLDELPPQRLAKGSCAMVLWDRQSRRRIAMVTAAPPLLTVVSDARIVGLPGTPEDAAGAVMGFAPRTSFRSAGMTIRLDLQIMASEGGGAVVRDGTLTLSPNIGDTIVAPVAGLVGCQ